MPGFGGYAAFRFDATAALKPGQDNVLAVRVDNAAHPDVAPLSADYTFFGGIYRSVGLISVDPLALRLGDYGGPGVYLRQRAVTTDNTSAPRAVAAASEFSTVQTLTVRDPRHWQSKADPYLYRAHVEILDAATGRVTDALSQPLGQRSATVDESTGFSLNGRRLQLRGLTRTRTGSATAGRQPGPAAARLRPDGRDGRQRLPHRALPAVPARAGTG
ncbi:hypothetical protein N8J89_29635 [Crossiella sp. CA-258035]|uniref:hypothetical protein n=1 Tax=Crossiella sp. CA-258035 TaxID=2981138 RepID=UPI0024BC8FD8|nr:hypothetical protein [Crossiella sp. CA-258035]WHT17267.1 hypothetical protein N8J89_29635 [Crossiella sp. CA-258035]